MYCAPQYTYPALISAFSVIEGVHLHSKKFEKHDFSMRKLYWALTIEADSFDEGLVIRYSARFSHSVGCRMRLNAYDNR